MLSCHKTSLLLGEPLVCAIPGLATEAAAVERLVLDSATPSGRSAGQHYHRHHRSDRGSTLASSGTVIPTLEFVISANAACFLAIVPIFIR